MLVNCQWTVLLSGLREAPVPGPLLKRVPLWLSSSQTPHHVSRSQWSQWDLLQGLLSPVRLHSKIPGPWNSLDQQPQPASSPAWDSSETIFPSAWGVAEVQLLARSELGERARQRHQAARPIWLWTEGVMEEKGGRQSQLSGGHHILDHAPKSKSCDFEAGLAGPCEGLYVKAEHVLLNGLIISFLTFQYLGIQ